MQEQNLPQLPEYYQTGNTKPPKSHNSIIAVLLVLVILLSGIVSVMGLMNIHLFRALMNRQEESAALAFESAPAEEESDLLLANYAMDATQAAFSGGSAIGIWGQDISPFHEQFYGVPRGVYITGIDDTGMAYAQGLRAKDIILNFNGVRVTDCAGLRHQLGKHLPGEQATLTVFRAGSRFELIITLLEDVQ